MHNFTRARGREGDVPHPDNLRDLGCKRGSKEAGVGRVKRKGAAELGQVGIFQASVAKGGGKRGRKRDTLLRATTIASPPRQTFNPSQLISTKSSPRLSDDGNGG